jgi:putative NAD(P)-binding protein
MYEYAIVGAGPTGLTLAYYLAKYKMTENNSIILIDREDSLGGCHRVRRYGKEKLFTEHGPRIVIDNYFCLKNILNEFGYDFYDLYTAYNFSTNTSAFELFATLSFREILALVLAFLKFMVAEESSKHTTMVEFTTYHQFSEESKLFVDKLCRLSDGGTIENYTLYEFLQIFNQNFFYGVYQPKYPNDICLFSIWENTLCQTGKVTILLNSNITNFTNDGLVITNTANPIFSNVISAKNYIFTIPPKPMTALLKNCFNPNMFGDFNKLCDFAIRTNYLVYIPIIFHWDVDLEHVLVPEKHAGPESSYGIVFVIMSKYMKFTNPLSKTVIVCTVKNANQVSPRNGKSANECNEQELIQEVYLQLRELQPGMRNAPHPTRSILDPGIYFNTHTQKYDTLDTAFFLTKYGYWSSESIYNNISWIGTHNGNSSYSFTSMESAMQNAIYWLDKRLNLNISLRNPFTVKQALWIVILLILILIFLIYRK